MTEQASVLKHIPLFAGLPAADQAELQAILRRRVAAPGAVLMTEGEPGDSVIIIAAGEADIFKAWGTDDQRLLRTLGPGDFLGEMSLFERSGRRTATVVARAGLEFLAIDLADFDALLQRRPQLAYEVMRVMSLRLREADNATIRDLREKNVQLAQAYEDLKAAQAQLIEKERLEEELRLAGEIQRSMLPQELPQLAGFEFGTVMQPARAVGGDFYDFIPLGRDDLGIVIGDVSDKGMPAAMFMALTRSLVRAEASRGAFPGEVLRRVNQHLLGMNESGMFVTALYGILHGPSGRFLYARAGHEMPLVVDAASQPVAVVRGQGQLLGLLPQPDLDEQAIAIPRGGRMVLFTDGLTDMIDPTGQIFGPGRVLEGLHACAGLPVPHQCQHLQQILSNFQDSAPQFDDFVAIIVHNQ